MPLALSTAAASGVFKKSMNALAACASLVPGGDGRGEHQILLQVGGEGAGKLDARRDQHIGA
jgi:hypothetical protein